MELVDELANLKRLRTEEEDARKRTIRSVKPSISTAPSHESAPDPETQREEAGRRRSRRERLSSTSTTDNDSDDESLFSKNYNTSSRMSLSSASTTSSPETFYRPDLTFTAIHPAQVACRQTQTARIPSTKSQEQREQGENCVWSCANCQGGAASEAWGVVGMLKEENRCLKERVQHVEGALEGCLDVVARLG